MELKDALELLERVGSWALAAAGVALAARKRVAAIVRAVVLAEQFRHQFGPASAETIRAILDDVTRSQSVHELRHRIQERTLRVGIYVCGPDGRCTWANEWLAESFGIDRADMRGYGWLNAIDGKERPRILEQWKFAIKNGTPYQTEYVVENKRSGKTWTAQTESFAVIQDGAVVCHVGYVVPKRSVPDSDVTHA